MHVHRFAAAIALSALLIGCTVTTYQIGGKGPEYEANWRWCYGTYTSLCYDAYQLAVHDKSDQAFLQIQGALDRGGFYDGDERADLLYNRAILQLYFGQVDAGIASLEEALNALPKGASRVAFETKLFETRKATGR